MGQHGRMTATEDVLGTITVTVFTDGGMQSSFSPALADNNDAVRRAAWYLERIAAMVEAEKQPVACPTCGVTILGIDAPPAGPATFAPCGHRVPAD